MLWSRMAAMSAVKWRRNVCGISGGGVETDIAKVQLKKANCMQDAQLWFAEWIVW